MTEQPTYTYRYCHNCHYPLPPQAKYCPQCSQKYTDGRETFGHLIHEVIHTKFHLDSTFFNTLRYIFIPGKLTEEFFKGKHKRYAHPIRLFLVLGVLSFALIEGKMFHHEDNSPAHNEQYITAAKAEMSEEFEHLRHQWLQLHPQADAQAVLDSVDHFLSEGSDSISIGNITWSGLPVIELEGDELKFSKKDIFLLSNDSLIKKYQIKGSLAKLFISQSRKAFVEGETVLKFFIHKLFYTLFLMIPVIAVFMKLLYVRHKYLFIEHFIFLLHYHCFLFALLSGLMLLSKYTSDLLVILAISGTAVFFFMALKKVYRQGFFKTLIKQNILLGFYIVMLIFFMAITAAYSFFTF